MFGGKGISRGAEGTRFSFVAPSCEELQAFKVFENLLSVVTTVTNAYNLWHSGSAFLRPVLESFLHGDADVRTTAVRVVLLMLRQGLVQPSVVRGGKHEVSVFISLYC